MLNYLNSARNGTPTLTLRCLAELLFERLNRKPCEPSAGAAPIGFGGSRAPDADWQELGRPVRRSRYQDNAR